MRVLVLGGIGEARGLATALHGRRSYAVTSSLAGRVAKPFSPPGEVRVGGFGGVDGLVGWLRAHHIDAVVDATHPFAARISAHAVTATARLRLPLLVLRREGWTAGPGDRWHRVPSPGAAAERLSGLGERVFLATGRGDLTAFAGLDDLWFLLRAVEPPGPPLPRRCHVLLDRGPFTAEAERALLVEHRIDVVVARDSGGDMTAAKLAAARELGLPVVLLDRPPTPDAPPAVGTVADAVRWLDECRLLTRPRTPRAPPAGAPDGDR